MTENAQDIAAQVAARYASVPFDEIMAAVVGGVRRQEIESLRSSANFLLRTFEGQRCDSEGVADCLRCQAVRLARATLASLEGVKTVSELAREHVEAISND